MARERKSDRCEWSSEARRGIAPSSPVGRHLLTISPVADNHQATQIFSIHLFLDVVGQRAWNFVAGRESNMAAARKEDRRPFFFSLSLSLSSSLPLLIFLVLVFSSRARARARPMRHRCSNAATFRPLITRHSRGNERAGRRTVAHASSERLCHETPPSHSLTHSLSHSFLSLSLSLCRKKEIKKKSM